MLTRKAALAASFACLLAGCAATGAKFSSPEAGPAGKGIVYFYRPYEVMGAGVALSITDNNEHVVNLRAGQYVKYVVDPGKHTFEVTETIADVKPVDISVQQGETYYVRWGIRSGFFVNTLYLTRVYPEEAIPELKECCKSDKLE
jgi:hypothetical protein